MIYINRKDIFWNYTATFFKLFSSLLLIPLILHKMSSNVVGIWNIFLTISSFLALVDFGFNGTFTRTITYIFSGVQQLTATGHETYNEGLDYNKSLLKGTVKAMQKFYFRLAAVVLIILITFGTLYIRQILKSYNGDHFEIYVAWFLFVLINTYNLYTLYYEALLLGAGLVKRSKQIIIIGQVLYLVAAAAFILFGFNLIAIVAAQVLSVIAVRYLSYKSIFTPSFNKSLSECKANESDKIFKSIVPNAVKMGLTSLGGFMVQKSAILIGSLFLTLSEIASYGITVQIINVIATVALIYHTTYLPKITQLRVLGDNQKIRLLYIKGKIIYAGLFLIGALLFYYVGSNLLHLLKSNTNLVSDTIMIFILIIAFIENNIIMASNIILTKNEVPFYKASLASGFLIVFFLFLSFKFTQFGILSMVIVPLMVDIAYQGWKWPLDVIKELGITLVHYKQASIDLFTVNSKQDGNI
jgi:O-antigen/teichoic acid export membrane protein